MKPRHPVRRGLTIALAVLSNACYSYTSRGTAIELPANAKVAGDLTSRAMADREILIGANVERVEGTLVRATGDSVELRLRRTLGRQGAWTTWSGEAVTFGKNDFATFGERRLSRTRTAVAVGGMLAAVILALTTDFYGFGDIGSSDPRPIPPVPPG